MSAAELLGLTVIIGSGLTAGVLFAVALSVVPALRTMPPSTYVYVHQRIGRHWDPTMPLIVLGSTVVDLVLAFVVAEPAARLGFVVAAVLLLAVSVVSHFCNVPLNRTVKVLDPESIPVDWEDPRPIWRRWHLLRTGLAVLALAVNAFMVILLL
ncbi:anthrone oxygenase family protein [Asanoa iriomotensis]|uniref:DUF1772 domain-containing protein n=1 Tax=Asanoa iriomotensis TaxID=234613 RepID=A0ABQ4C1X1_9ACTN|nr:DUF1772 domain-containing protein [Asanoa iriomotensis]GIF56426.1 hypothetical protein Air01nite_25210 [Asanoa iriomotensis]